MTDDEHIAMGKLLSAAHGVDKDRIYLLYQQLALMETMYLNLQNQYERMKTRRGLGAGYSYEIHLAAISRIYMDDLL